MSNENDGPYAVPDSVWSDIRPAAEAAGRKERNAAAITTIALVGAVLFCAVVWGVVESLGVLHPLVSFVGGGGGHGDGRKKTVEVDLRIYNRGILPIAIDGPATMDVPGVVVNRVTTSGPVPAGQGATHSTDEPLFGNGRLTIQATVTACDKVKKHYDNVLRHQGAPGPLFRINLIVPVQTWRGTQNVAVDDSLNGASTLVEMLASVCEVDPDAPPKPDPRREAVVLKIPGEFVPIPPGTFTMGHKVQKHRVTIDKGFEMSKYPVTEGLWRAVMGIAPDHPLGDDFPITYIRLDEIQAFVGKLNARNDGYHYRLPNEAEWEYASRAGTTTEPDFNEAARSRGNPHPIGTGQPNAWGLYDMLEVSLKEMVELKHPSAANSRDPQYAFAWIGGFGGSTSLHKDDMATYNHGGFRCIREAIAR